jgi:hypothetical protein
MSRGDDAYRDLVGRGPVEGHEWFRPDVVRFSVPRCNRRSGAHGWAQ